MSQMNSERLILGGDVLRHPHRPADELVVMSVDVKGYAMYFLRSVATRQRQNSGTIKVDSLHEWKYHCCWFAT